MTTPASERRVSFLGITVHPTTLTELTDSVGELIESHQQAVVANHNVRSLHLFHHDARFRAFYQRSALTHIDGMPIIALARLYGHSLRREQRITYVDWMNPLMERATSCGWRVFYLGSAQGVADHGARVLQCSWPGLTIATASGYFDATRDGAENRRVLTTIREYRPHLLMVGMGMPRQEHWILENLDQLPAAVILPCGAAIDYVAGALPTPPRWAGRCGLEWLFRLKAEPRRLWRRYLLEPWSILWIIARDFLVRRARHLSGPLPDEFP